MSATPQDFSIWSRMTGNPYPSTPEERMYLAPHVRSFVQNIGRQGAYPVQQESGIKRAVKAVGKTALAAGLLVGGVMAAHHYLKDDDGGGGGGSTPPPPGGGHDIADNLENIHSTASDVLKGKSLAHPLEERGEKPRLTGTVMTKLPLLLPAQNPEAAESNIQAGTPFETPAQDIIAQEIPAPALAADEPTSYKGQEAAAFRKSQVYKLRQKQAGASPEQLIGQTAPSAVEAFRQTPGYLAEVPQVIKNSGDVTPPTTADRYGQDIVPTEIRVRQVAKGAAPGSVARESLRTKPVTESEHLATSQTSAPSVQTLATPGPSHQEIRELDEILTKAHGWTHSREQRDMMRNEILSKKYGAQSEAKYEPSGHMVQTSAQPAPKDFLRQGVEKMKNIAQLRHTGYDPEQGFGATLAPGAEQMGPSHHDLLAEQLQRESGRQAEQANIYKKLQAQRASYAPQPQDMMAVHGQGFFHPSAYGRL